MCPASTPTPSPLTGTRGSPMSGSEKWSWPWPYAKSRHLLLVSVLSGLAVLLTPYGPRLAAYPFQLMHSQPLNVFFVVEWRQLDLSTWWGQAFLLLVLAWIAAQVISPIVYPLEIIAPLLGVTYECLDRNSTR